MKTLFLGWFFLLSMVALAQDDFYKEQPKPVRRQYAITLQDGTKLIGELIRQDSLETVIKTRTMGQVTVKASQIVASEPVDGNAAATVGYPNRFPQYLNFTPTAYSAERGRLYYRNSLVFYNQLDYGMTDNWSVGAGVFIGPPITLLSLTTKVSFPVSKAVRLGVQGQYFTGNTFIFNRERFGFSYVQGIASIGTPQRNVTIGLGTILEQGRLGEVTLLTVGIVRKINPTLTFISENRVLVGPDVDVNLFLSGGLRFDRRRHSFDIAATVAYFPGLGSRIGLFPYASYQLRIGK